MGSLLCLFYLFSFQIEGIVVDVSTGKPLAGANIVVKGTPYGASSDSKGRFIIKGLDKGRYRLIASLLGYKEETKYVSLSKERAGLNSP